MMHEDILPLILGDESEAPLIIKPFTFSARHTYSMFFLPWWVGDPARTLPPKSPIQQLTPANGYFFDARQFRNIVKSSFARKMAKKRRQLQEICANELIL